jgi:hypothetical protein
MTKGLFRSQGALDGLCGQYAVVNAFTELHAAETYAEQAALFKAACHAIAKKRWPGAVQAGTSFYDLKAMIAAAQKKAGDAVTVSYPFENGVAPKRRAADYLAQLLDLVPRAGKGCAILCIRRASDAWEDHWIVARRRGGRLQFIDSVDQRGGTITTRNPASLRVGALRKQDSHWYLPAKDQVVIFAVRG